MIPKATRFIALLAALVTSSAASLHGQQPAAGHQPDEVDAVLGAMDRYMLAISANDLRAMDSLQTQDGMTYRVSPREDGSWNVRAQPNLYWVSPSRADARVYRERYWSPTVLVRGAIAVVWSPYEFWVNGQTTHCGVDVFSFVKADGKWLVANSMWTVEPRACSELRPSDAASVRPRAP